MHWEKTIRAKGGWVAGWMDKQTDRKNVFGMSCALKASYELRQAHWNDPFLQIIMSYVYFVLWNC